MHNPFHQFLRLKFLGVHGTRLAFVLAFPALFCPYQEARAAVATGKVTFPYVGPVKWRRVPDSMHRGSFLPSVLRGGTVLGIPAAGLGQRTATWSFTNLRVGYYRVEILYYRHPNNAKNVLVAFLRTFDTAFTAFPARLNQTIGDGQPPQIPTIRPLVPILRRTVEAIHQAIFGFLTAQACPTAGHSRSASAIVAARADS
jgi:hypothetical protein